MRESFIHENVAQYLKLRYPDVLFRTDFAAGIKMTWGQAIKHKRLQAGRAWPDFFIAEPRGPFHGLFLELKADGTRIILKNGKVTANKHIREQEETLRILRKLGYFAGFCIGFEEARNTIEGYFELPRNTIA